MSHDFVRGQSVAETISATGATSPRDVQVKSLLFRCRIYSGFHFLLAH